MDMASAIVLVVLLVLYRKEVKSLLAAIAALLAKD